MGRSGDIHSCVSSQLNPRRGLGVLHPLEWMRSDALVTVGVAMTAGMRAMYKPYLHWDTREEKPEKSSSKTNDKPRRGSAARLCDPSLLDNRLILIHPLVLCPPIEKGERYLLVERKWWGQRDVLKVGRARSPHEA